MYKGLRLNLRRAGEVGASPRECVALYVPRLPDTVWSADLMSDALACGRRFRTFNVLDDFNREVSHIAVDTPITSARLVRIFEQLKQYHSRLPQVLRTDNGPEFLGESLVEWVRTNGVAIQYIQPGKPNQSTYVERFNRTFRDEVLNQHLFVSLADTRKAAWWRSQEFNQERLHESLGDLTTREFGQLATSGSISELSA